MSFVRLVLVTKHTMVVIPRSIKPDPYGAWWLECFNHTSHANEILRMSSIEEWQDDIHPPGQWISAEEPLNNEKPQSFLEDYPPPILIGGVYQFASYYNIPDEER